MRLYSSTARMHLNVLNAAQKIPAERCHHLVFLSATNSNHPLPAVPDHHAQAAAPRIVRAVGPEILPRSDNTRAIKYDERTDKLVRRVRDLIIHEDLIQEGDRVLLAVSGGIDSTVLLFLLLEIRETIPFEIALAHVNHQLRGRESQRDETFVRKLSKRLGLRLFVQRADVRDIALRHHLSLQHAGREARYGFFNTLLAKHGYTRIAVAHNLDDQVETFLLRSIKGSGLRGISAIPIKRDAIIRPLLHTYRSEIALFAGRKHISFVEDSSNSKTVYERNFVRKEIIPQMERLNPKVKEKLFALLSELSDVNRLFLTQAQSFCSNHVLHRDGDIMLNVNKLRQIDDEIKYRIISDCIAALDSSVMLLREHFRQISRIVMGAKPNAVLYLPNGIKVKKIYDSLILTTKATVPDIDVRLPVSIGVNRLEPFGANLTISHVRKPLNLGGANPNIAYLDADKLGRLTVRTFMNGDRFVPLGMKSSVKLKDFFISLKIPREQRKSIPLLCSDGDIVWITGIRIDDRFKITDSTKKKLKIAVKPISQSS